MSSLEKGGKLRVALVGAGVRGSHLASRLPLADAGCEVAAVAEPDRGRRESFARAHSLGAGTVFSSWEELFLGQPGCDAVIVATLDNQHTGPALEAARRGWHLLLEKPMADKFDECLAIDRMCREKNIVARVCHSLRFMDPFKKAREICASGRLGRIIHVEHMEAVGNLRFTHNYVRGKWGREDANTFLLLHKCCHDIDFINWIVGGKCARVSSFGSLSYFNPANAPGGSGTMCLVDCSISGSCPYSARRLYLDADPESWPARDVRPASPPEARLEAVRSGHWGRCVWRAGNDVPDHQVVGMEYDDGATATCALSGFSAVNGRRARIQGTQGELFFDEAEGRMVVSRFDSGASEALELEKPDSYHPEDLDIVADWVSAIRGGGGGGAGVDTGSALRSHAIVFAAERSRLEGRTVELSELLR